MIKVKYYYSKNNELQGFSLKGHANHGVYGEDIVCSAATSNAVGIINSLTELVGANFDTVVANEGHIECRVSDDSIEKSQILLKHFQLTIGSIAESYPKNLKILK
ncbi:MAG: ribosomal-processing cysteine protease Prp [Culicoidibacterales bacterium]